MKLLTLSSRCYASNQSYLFLIPKQLNRRNDMVMNLPQSIEQAEPRELEVLEPLREATLLSHAGTSKVMRLDLAAFPVPPETDTFKPIAHSLLIETTWRRRWLSGTSQSCATSTPSRRTA